MAPKVALRRRRVLSPEKNAVFFKLLVHSWQMQHGVYAQRRTPTYYHQAMMFGDYRNHIFTCCDILKGNRIRPATHARALLCWRCLHCPGCIVCRPVYAAATARLPWLVLPTYWDGPTYLFQLTDADLVTQANRAARNVHLSAANKQKAIEALTQETQLRCRLLGR